jgi:ABC-type polysaccharide/polyol phosphate transport system ATPase subunit
MSEKAAVQVEHLTKVYKIFDKPINRLKESLNPFHKRYSKDFYALEDLSFTINQGETMGIIGKNGAGKSTLLKIITGVLTPSAGKIQVNGRIASLLELGAGFNPEMTGIDNIYLNGTVMGYTRAEMDERLQDIIDFADIGDFIEQPVKMYSSGMFARLAFAVNAYVEPDILIVDEALSVGDAAFQTKCITRMRQMMKSGVTILFVTHDMSVVKNFCKRCIYLEHGKMKLQGKAEDVADIYLREIRDEMNAANQENEVQADMKVREKPDQVNAAFKESAAFSERVKLFRQGDGKVRVTCAELLDCDGVPLAEAEFNQQIVIRIYMRFYDTVDLCVGFHIRDDKNLELIGSATAIESNKVLQGEAGDQYIVSFTTRVPLTSGRYNVTLVLSSMLDPLGETAIFRDLIENACIFTVSERKPVRIWNKVYLPTEYKLEKV